MSYISPDAFRIKALITSVSARQLSGTSWADVTGTEIAYTPHPRATHVVYSACFLASTYGTSPHSVTMHFKLLKDGSDYGNNTNFNWRSTGSVTPASSLITFEHEIPTWSGEQTLKMQFRKDVLASFGHLHQSTYFDGSQTVYFDPNLLIYSIVK